MRNDGPIEGVINVQRLKGMKGRVRKWPHLTILLSYKEK
jgi:hypothetical protein